ncbi:hypothetical protein INS49_005772 [Diaporthe citri]|uniref:uncharacterized protein n=1 Tax=Diaporthe citri TaxID=83186 RepID=UPI001C800A35|nr:uncharacterized protein INS49_005772 [Diaporthe citri]KAG6364174.1 hypothetical protein INS49_005772 [Diaporthe citri]
MQSDIQPRSPQGSSLFLKLPTEIRLEIYTRVFYSTRLSFGGRVRTATPVSLSRRLTDSANLENVQLRSAPNSLSLLRVCRRVNSEIGHSWIGQVLFSFEGAQTTFRKLTALEPSVLAKLRLMRMSGQQPRLKIGGDYRTTQRGWDNMLKVLTGLCLDRLIILGDRSLRDDLPTVAELIKHSDGWKELYYLLHSSAILEFTDLFWSLGDVYGARGPSIFNSSLPLARSFLARPKPIEECGAELNAALTRQREENKKKELLFVAHKGKGVDYAVKPGSTLLPNDTREVTLRKGRIRGGIRSGFVKVDTYEHVDDYEWTPMHLHSGFL